MLPSSLKSIYHQYKADTNSVASWLATTSKANGYAEDTNGNAAPAGSSTRLKGKARKMAKAQAAKSNSQNSNSASRAKYVLRIRDFEPMASFIAKLESITIPEDFAIALERVIWGTQYTFVTSLATRLTLMM